MQIGKLLLTTAVLLILTGCEQAKEFKYYVKNGTHDSLNVFVEYSISAKGHRSSDTLNILPGDKKMVYTHQGLGGFYTGAVKSVRFSGMDTLRQAWRNRGRSEINKHFFRRNSWKLIHYDDNEEQYLFRVTSEDLRKKE